MSSLKTVAEGKGEVLIHNLLTREVRPIRDWSEWFDLWKKAETMEQMLGLLHVGFNMPFKLLKYGDKEYDEIDRLTFYLTAAFGWANDYLLRLPGDEKKEYSVYDRKKGGEHRKLPYELRQQVAIKAFDMLCLNLFKTELREPSTLAFHGIWENFIASERLFPVIIDFFRVEEGPYRHISGRIRNLPRHDKQSHNERVVIDFVINLINFIWEWRERKLKSWFTPEFEKETTREETEMRSRLDSAKPWTIEVLSELDQLGLLRKWILDLDKASLAKLKEIALRSKLHTHRHPVKKDRQVERLDEALYIGSPAAWLLKEHEVAKREHARLTAIREAEEKKEEAEQKLKNLTSAKK